MLDLHEASEKVEALRRLDLGLLEQHAILLECRPRHGRCRGVVAQNPHTAASGR